MTTIYDVAKKANVSHAAVSAVLNGRDDQVGAATRERILRIVKELNYKPSRIARQLKTGKYQTIALCFVHPSHPSIGTVSSPLVAGIIDAAADAGSFVLVSPTKSQDKLIELVNSFSSHGIGGALIAGPLPIEGESARMLIDAIDASSVPVVCADSYPNFKNTCSVDIDNFTSMKDGVEYLISKGHRRIALFREDVMHQCNVDRRNGYITAMLNAGLSVDEHICNCTEAADCIGAIASSENKPTAWVCDSRFLGETTWDLLMELGIDVPRDMSLMVFDGLTDGHVGTNRTNAILPAFHDVGYASFKLLHDVIVGKAQSPQNLRIPAKLVTV